ncbi:MAG: nitroreductase family protein [Puniceicoccales bacterium]|jgi:nitroreductase|nr:nitroreductase family protein [Puniceicoccales bacterium]
MKENSTIQSILARRSVRSYSQKEVSREDMDTILNCGIHAPTAWHREPWAIRAIQDRETLRQFDLDCLEWIKKAQPSAAGLFSGESASVFYHAPALVIVSGDRSSPFATIDCSLVGENLMIAANALGIGSCAIGFAAEFLKSSDGNPWKKKFKIADNFESVIAIIFGHATSATSSGSNRDASKIIYI